MPGEVGSKRRAESVKIHNPSSLILPWDPSALEVLLHGLERWHGLEHMVSGLQLRTLEGSQGLGGLWVNGDDVFAFGFPDTDPDRYGARFEIDISPGQLLHLASAETRQDGHQVDDAARSPPLAILRLILLVDVLGHLDQAVDLIVIEGASFPLAIKVLVHLGDDGEGVLGDPR